MIDRRAIFPLLVLCAALCPWSASLADDAPDKTGQGDTSDTKSAVEAVGEVSSQVGNAITLIGVSQQMMQKCKDDNGGNCDQKQQDPAPKDGD